MKAPGRRVIRPSRRILRVTHPDSLTSIAAEKLSGRTPALSQVTQVDSLTTCSRNASSHLAFQPSQGVVAVAVMTSARSTKSATRSF